MPTELIIFKIAEAYFPAFLDYGKLKHWHYFLDLEI